MELTEKQIEQFWAKVSKPDEHGCMLWSGAIFKDSRPHVSPYGMVGIHGKPYRSHRIAWEITHGAIPKGKCVCHSCDHTLCCNPDHLFIGTHQENMRDMIQKGRGKFQHITVDQAGDLRTRYAAGGCTQDELALGYGLSRSAISMIVTSKAYGWLDNPCQFVTIKKRGPRGEKNGNAKLQAEQVADIRQRYAQGGVSQRQLAAEYGIGQSAICEILNRHKWAWLP